MRGFVGQDVRQVMLSYGPPVNEIDLGAGSRAFQWSRTSVDTTPLSATTTTRNKKGREISETEFIGGTQTVTNCLYTFYAAWTPDRQGWIVTGFRQPGLDCAIGGLN